MNDILDDEFREFIRRINHEKSSCIDNNHIKAYERGIELTMSLLEENEFNTEKYELLNRYIDDCLPWTENILEVWNKISKAIRKR